MDSKGGHAPVTGGAVPSERLCSAGDGHRPAAIRTRNRNMEDWIMYNCDVSRFEEMYDEYFGTVRAELAGGRKRSHWMWFIFPQIFGLG